MTSLDHLVCGALDLCLAGALIGCVYALVAAVLVRRLANAPQGSRSELTPVTLLKPLHGEEPDLLPRLASFCTQAYAGPTQVVFGCQDGGDPAIGVVKRLQASLPDCAPDLVADSRSHGENRKISNLINMITAARHDVFVVSDSDIEVHPNYLAAVMDALEQPGVGVVTCLYHGVPSNTLASSLSALAINAHFLPNVVVALSLGLADPCFGSTIALRRETLKQIGGFRAFADQLADDYHIGQAVRAAGYRVVFPAFSVGHACIERTLRDFFHHQLRCARTIKSLDRLGYAGAIITNPVPLALIGALDRADGTLLLIAASVLLRLALCKRVERAFDLPRQPYWLLPATDLVLFAVYVSSFFGSSVTWRGRRYRILSKGALSQDPN